MPQTLAPFHLEHTTSTGTVTARGGAALLLEAFYATGLHEASRSIRRRPNRGYDDADHVMTVILLNLLGLASCDDVEHLRDDKVLGDLCGSMKAHHGSRSRMDSAFPSPPALRKWLHEVGESKASLRSVKELIYGPLHYIQERKVQKIATLDMDATFIPTCRGGAPYNYKSERSNEAFNVYWLEQDMILNSEYTTGNVSPRKDQLGLLRRSLQHLPRGVKQVKLRADSAGYDRELIRYCNEGKSPYGVIGFCISVPMYSEFRRSLRKIPEGAWKRYDKDSWWAEVNIVPNRLCLSKKDKEVRYIAIRQEVKGLTEAKESDARQMELEIEGLEADNPNLKKLHLMVLGGKVWKTFLIVTNNLTEPGDEVIRWHRGRCGKSEEIHAVLKRDLAGGHVPTGSFEANAAWWYLSVLSFNLQRLVTHHVLPPGWSRYHQKHLLATIYTAPARIVRHAGQVILRIAGSIGRMLEDSHWELLRLHHMRE